MTWPTESSITTGDGLQLRTFRWLPKEAPRALVFIVHGYGEHSGRYAWAAEQLVSRGYAAFAIDHRSHGKSGGEPRAYIDSIPQVVADLKQFVDQVSAEFPHIRRFMLGHSMGGLIAWSYTVRHQDTLSGLISSGAAIDADANVSPAVAAIGELLAKIAPKMPFLDLAPMAELAANPDVAPAFEADPLTYKGKMRIGIGIAISHEARYIKKRLGEVMIPVLILHGELDKIVNPSGSKRAFEAVGSAQRTHLVYEGMRHEILNERERDIVMSDILGFINGLAEK
ncbi:MAG: lysophospholipase [Pleurocapsa minor GSE-CHR-MK-17-07R]|jgi:alpha-beta hydrolase superfamily lysophospholipase|nr:lysophospholipase [Pleurocapsa minor GSE-CHR-MK 17-07R]